MSAITVTSVAGASLALHSCTACGRHEWHRDGTALDRSSLLGVVRDRIAEGPAPRRGGGTRPVRARAAVVRTARAAELRRQLAGLPTGRGDDSSAAVGTHVPAAAGAALPA